jgi:hypothetical protein
MPFFPLLFLVLPQLARRLPRRPRVRRRRGRPLTRDPPPGAGRTTTHHGRRPRRRGAVRRGRAAGGKGDDGRRRGPAAGKRLAGAAVLVAEDEAVIALDLDATLRRLGCRVLGPAGSVEGALTLLAADRPAAALLDVALLDGWSAAVAEALARETAAPPGSRPARTTTVTREPSGGPAASTLACVSACPPAAVGGPSRNNAPRRPFPIRVP